MPLPRVRAMLARRWYWPVVTAAALGAFALFGDRLRDEYRVTAEVELLTPDRSTRVASTPNPFDIEALAGVVGQRLRTPEQLTTYRSIGLSDDARIGLDEAGDSLVISADHPDETVAAATVERLVGDARASLTSVQLAMGVGEDRTVVTGAMRTAPTAKVLSEERTTQLGVAASVLWVSTALVAAMTRHQWSKRRKKQHRAALAAARAVAPPVASAAPASDAAAVDPPAGAKSGLTSSPAAPPPTPGPARDPVPPRPPAGAPSPSVAHGPDGRLPMQPAPRSAARRRSAPARGPVRSTPTAGATQPPSRALPPEPRTIDGGHRPKAAREATAEPGGERRDDVIDLRDGSDPLDDSTPVHPGRRGATAADKPLTRFSPAASWPGQQGTPSGGPDRRDSLFGAAGVERAPVPAGGADASADETGNVDPTTSDPASNDA